MSWRLAKSLETLRSQVNQAYPNRSKVSDGTIGDAAHRRVNSDHNPNPKGVVCALDITHDPKVLDAHKLADHLRLNRHPNLKYIISNKRIASAGTGWAWRPYGGANPHTQHIHISVGVGSDGYSAPPYDSTAKWDIGKGDTSVTQEQILTSRPVFNAAYYLKVNRDVARHKNTQAYALEHWLEYGVKEGRPSAPNFHVKEYMANYGDLRRTYGTNYQKAVNHYFVHGINEGRAGRKKTTVQVVDRTSELKNKIIDFVKGLK